MNLSPSAPCPHSDHPATENTGVAPETETELSELETVTSQFWSESGDPDNPFAASQCLCSGFDVYADLLRNANWIEYLYLLFRYQQPTADQAKLLNGVALAIANPGPRDHSVQASMSAAAGGSNQASSLIAALAVGAGNLGGAREVLIAMSLWQQLGTDSDLWQEVLAGEPSDLVTELAAEQGQDSDVWLPMEHHPGFDPYGSTCPLPVRQTLEYLAKSSPGTCLPWLLQHRRQLEHHAGIPLAMSGVAAAALVDLELEPEQGEMLYLLLRLPGAAAHAIEQRWQGWKNYPFNAKNLNLTDDPAGSGQ